MTSEFADHASGIVRWRDASEGGRRSGPAPGPEYFATAVFVSAGNSESSGEHFSIAITLGDQQPDGEVPARFRFFAPELLGPQLVAGAMFYVMEGPGVVGEAEITLISKEYQ